MRIVLYNTRSNYFDGRYIKSSYYPERADEWDRLAKSFKEHEFIVVAKKPGGYLFDMDGEDVARLPEKVRYVYIEDESDAAVVDLIYGLAPAVAIAVSTTVGSTYDWNFVKDSMIAEQLEKRGVRTVAQKIFTSVACFDKWRSNLMLRSGGFAVAKAIYIHNAMFWIEKGDASLSSNVYKEYVMYRIREMEYPVIIKSTAGSGSVGIQIADNYEAAKEILLSGDNDGDLIVEEMLKGEQFGTEIHGANGNYHVLPPFALSTNSEGITDPYKGIKFGPVMNERYHIRQLQESLRRMAEQFQFAGVTQIDLVFRNDRWYVIEINPRWSGMTATTAAAEGRSPYSIFVECVTGSKTDYSKWENLKYSMNFKMPDIGDERLEEMAAYPGVQYIGKTVADHPGREKMVFCEVVFGGFDTKEEIKKGLMGLKEKFPEAVSDGVIENVALLSEKY